MPLRGNALLRRVRSHRSMTTLYRSSQLEAPVNPFISRRPQDPPPARAGITLAMAQLLPAGTVLPFGQLIPAEAIGPTHMSGPLPGPTEGAQTTPGQVARRLQTQPVAPVRPIADTGQPGVELPPVTPPPAVVRSPVESPGSTPPAETSPVTSRLPAKETPPRTPPPVVQREEVKPSPKPKELVTPPPGATADFSWISDSEWNSLKQFMEGHEEFQARKEASPEAIQRAEQEKAEQAAREQHEAEVARRQELARQGRLPKAEISYLSTETAGTTPLVPRTAVPTPQLKRIEEQRSEPQAATPTERPEPKVEEAKPTVPAQPAAQPTRQVVSSTPPKSIQAKEITEPKSSPETPLAAKEVASMPEPLAASAAGLPTAAEVTEVDEPGSTSRVEEPTPPVVQREVEAPASRVEPKTDESAGGFRRILDAARSFLRREESEEPTPTLTGDSQPTQVSAPVNIQREPAELEPTRPPETPLTAETEQGLVAQARETQMDTQIQAFEAAIPESRSPVAETDQEMTVEAAQGPESVILATQQTEPTTPPAAIQTARAVDHTIQTERQTFPEPLAAESSLVEPAVEEVTESKPPDSESVAERQPVAGIPRKAISTAESQAIAPKEDAGAQPPVDQPSPGEAVAEPPRPASAAVEPAMRSGTPKIQRETFAPTGEHETSATESVQEWQDFDSGDAETLIQPVPLESVWPVQQVDKPKPEATRQVTKKPAGPVAQRKPAGIDRTGEHIHETIKDIAPVEATDSSIEFITPRRPRPKQPKPATPTSPTIRREAAPEEQDQAAIREVTEQPAAVEKLEDAPEASARPTVDQPEAGQLQRKEQLPAKSGGVTANVDQPFSQQATEDSPVQRLAKAAEPTPVPQQEASYERQAPVDVAPIADMATIETQVQAPATPPPLQRSTDVSTPPAPAPVTGPLATTPGEPAQPYLVPTPIGDLPSDLWEMLGERPPTPSTVEQPSETAPRTIQRQVDTQPQPQRLVTEVFRTPDVQREEVTAGRTESAGTTQTTEAAGEEEGEKKSEVDVDALARKIYPEIRRRLEVEWERGRGRFR